MLCFNARRIIDKGMLMYSQNTPAHRLIPILSIPYQLFFNPVGGDHFPDEYVTLRGKAGDEKMSRKQSPRRLTPLRLSFVFDERFYPPGGSSIYGGPAGGVAGEGA